MVFFQKGNDNVFLNALGLKYGYLDVDGAKTTIADLESGLEVLSAAVVKQLATADEGQATMREMERDGILDKKSDVFNKARRHLMPLDFHATLGFRVCACGSPPVTHGHVAVEGTNYTVSKAITDLTMGFWHCNKMVRNDGVTTLIAITVFKQMLDSFNKPKP